jgi:hypothetical protein
MQRFHRTPRARLCRNLLALIIGLALGGFAACSAAQERSIVIHGFSYHSINNSSYNNVNPGIAYKHSNNVIVGVLKNSYSDPTVYLGYVYQHNDFFSITLGGAVGYEEAPVMPLVAATASFPLANRLRFNVSTLPMRADGRIGVVLHSGLEYRF